MDWWRELGRTVATQLPSIGAAFVILVFGWIGALVASRLTHGALRRSRFSARLAAATGVEVDEKRQARVTRLLSRAVYYLVLAFVVVAFFERLHVTAVTGPIVTALNGLAAAVPGVLKAGLIAVVGYALASLVRSLVAGLLKKTSLFSRLDAWTEGDDEPPSTKRVDNAHKTVAQVAFWFIIYLTAIPVLEALQIGALAAPLSAAFATVSTYLPKVVAAAILLALGYVLSKATRLLVGGALRALNVDRAASRVGATRLLGGASLSEAIAVVAMVFVFVHFAIGAVGRLEINEVSDSLGLVLASVYAYFPRLLVGAFLLAVGAVVARLGARAARTVLAAVGINALATQLGFGVRSDDADAQQEEGSAAIKQRLDEWNGAADAKDKDDGLVDEPLPLRTPADVGGAIVGAIVMVLFLKQALASMKLWAFAAAVDAFLAHLPNMVVAAALLAFGAWAAAWAAKRIEVLTSGSDDGLMRSLGAVARVTIVGVAAMLAASQLGIGTDLIAIAFGLLLGAVCLALALAFGLGGREVAADLLKERMRKRNARAKPGSLR